MGEAPPVLIIRGWPSQLGETEIRGLLETVGTLKALQLTLPTNDADGITCTCQYDDDESTKKAVKGFHELQMGDVKLRVENAAEAEKNAAEAAAAAEKAAAATNGKDDRSPPRRSSRRSRSRSRSRDRDRGRDRSRSRDRDDKRSRSPRREGTSAAGAPGGAAAEEAPRKKKSRFAPPPPGAAIAVAAGMNAAAPGGIPGLDPAAAAAAAVRALPGMMAGGLGIAGMMAGMGGVPGMGGGIPGMAGMAGHYGMGAAALSNPLANPLLKSQLELFVGNIPAGTSQQGLQDFMNAAMTQVGLATPGLGGVGPVTSARLSNKFAFLVFRSVEECTAAVRNMTGIPYLGHMLKVQRPSSYKGPAEECRTWQQLTGQEPPAPQGMTGGMTMGGGGGGNVFDKLPRELFIGNVPGETQPALLQEYLGTAMVQVGLVPADKGNPIVNIRMNPGSRFAFVEMRTVEDAANGLNLDGIPFGQASLSVARPSKYQGPATPHKTWVEMLAESSFLGGGGAMAGGGMAMSASEPATSVVRLGNVVTPDELVDTETYKEVVEDMREECSKYGRVVDLEIPRQGARSGGHGYVFVQYSNTDEATLAKRTFGARTFDQKPVEAIFFSEDKFKDRNFSD